LGSIPPLSATVSPCAVLAAQRFEDGRVSSQRVSSPQVLPLAQVGLFLPSPRALQVAPFSGRRLLSGVFLWGDSCL